MRERKLVVTPLDGAIVELARAADHRMLATWAADCAERVLPLFESAQPDDDRPRTAIAACREWVRTGIFHMAAIRRASLDAHAAARSVDETGAAHAAARSAGQAVAAAHVRDHAIAAAWYAASARRNAGVGDERLTAAVREREWQIQHMRDLLETATKDT